MTSPLFTVVVPTYRRPELLARALDSVAAQTLKGSQVIVVDDGDDAATRDVVAAHEGALYLVNDRGSGGSGARNAGIARADGEWVAFLDDDDTWAPRKLEAVSAVIRAAGPAVGVVYSAAEQVDAATGAVMSRSHPWARGRVLDETLYRNVVGGMSVVVVRRDVLAAVGGLDESFPSLQDMELYVRLAQRVEFEFVAEVLVSVRAARHGRITMDATKKLAGAKLFATKYRSLLARSSRLRHRTASRTLLLALAAGDRREAARNLPWTLAGLLVDPGNLGYVARGVGRWLRTGLSNRAPRAAVR